MNDICDSIIREMEANQFIPCRFVRYTQNILEKKKDGRYYEALLEAPSAVIKKIGNLMHSAGKILGLSPEELLEQSSFKENDFDSTKTSSFFAELRAIIYLNAEGFTNIRILQEGKKKRADFCAEKNGCKFAIEVTNASHEAKQGHWRHDEIVQLILNKLKAERKYKQLEETCGAEGCSRMALILVIDTLDKVALNTHYDYQDMLHDAWEHFSKIDQLHLSIVTGKMALGYGEDDVVYPAW